MDLLVAIRQRRHVRLASTHVELMYHTWRQRQWGRPPPPQPPSPPPQPQNSAAEPQVSEEKQSDGDDSASDALPQMSEYDLMWLENIRCNEALLGVDGTTQTAVAKRRCCREERCEATQTQCDFLCLHTC